MYIIAIFICTFYHRKVEFGKYYEAQNTIKCGKTRLFLQNMEALLRIRPRSTLYRAIFICTETYMIVSNILSVS